MNEADTNPGPRLLRGLALAEELERRVLGRAQEFQQNSGRAATAAVVGWSSDPTTAAAIDAKRLAFGRAGLQVEAVVLSSGEGTAAILRRIDALNEHAAVDGILVQFPFPAGIDGRSVLDRVAGGKDIDGGSAWSRQRLRRRAPCYVPATPGAVLRLLGAHEIPVEGRRVAVVGGQPAIAEPVGLLLQAAGVDVLEVGPDMAAAEAPQKVNEVEVVIAAAGKPSSVPSDWLPEGCILVDTGYYHGGGRGDVAPGPGMTRVAAWVPPLGGVGPVTVAILMENTLAAAEGGP